MHIIYPVPDFTAYHFRNHKYMHHPRHLFIVYINTIQSRQKAVRESGCLPPPGGRADDMRGEYLCVANATTNTQNAAAPYVRMFPAGADLF